MNGEQRRLDPRTFHPSPHEASGTRRAMQEARIEARRDGERYAAMVAGAVEGFLEALEKYRVGTLAQEAVDEAGQTAQAAYTGIRQEAQAPAFDPIREATGEAIENVRQTTHEKKQEWSEGLSHQADEAGDAIERGYDRVREVVDNAVDASKDAWDRTRNLTRRTVDESKARARFFAEGVDRATHAPGAMLRDGRNAAGAWMKGFWSSFGLYAVTGVIALAAFVVLTVATVVGLNAVLGSPEGAFVAFGIYAIGAVAAFIAARSAMEKGRQRARHHIAEARDEARSVVTPFERAFSGHWVTGEPAVVRPPPPVGRTSYSQGPLAPETPGVGMTRDPVHESYPYASIQPTMRKNKEM